MLYESERPVTTLIKPDLLKDFQTLIAYSFVNIHLFDKFSVVGWHSSLKASRERLQLPYEFVVVYIRILGVLEPTRSLPIFVYTVYETLAYIFARLYIFACLFFVLKKRLLPFRSSPCFIRNINLRFLWYSVGIIFFS